MRLTCPNCGAQYEVPDDVIPLAGRDVQCSNCGDTWFQPHPTTEAEAANAEDTDAPDMADPEDPASPRFPEDPPAEFEEVEPPEISLADEKNATAPAEAEGDGAFDEAEDDWNLGDGLEDIDKDDGQSPAPEPEEEAEPEEQEPPHEPPAAPPRPSLDPEIADVLRQEAEHEARAREADTLESQPELGLSDPESESDRRLLQAKARMRRLRGLPEDTPETASPEDPATPGSRRDLLPDIEEINSTLRGSGRGSVRGSAETGAGEAAGPTELKRRRGFRLGFGLALLIALAAILAYSNDDRIVASYPQTEPYLTAYVDGANRGRVWLDSQVTNLFLRLNSIASGD